MTFWFFILLSESAPGVQFLQGDHQLFNVIITAHAFIMIFFMILPGLVGGYGNYILPVYCGSINKTYPCLTNIWTPLLKWGQIIKLLSIQFLRELTWSQWSQVLRCFYEILVFLFIFLFIFKLVWAFASLVYCLSMLPYLSDFYIFQMNVDLPQGSILLSFSLFYFKVYSVSQNRNLVYSVSQNRTFSSSNFWYLDKHYLKVPLKSNTNLNLYTSESKIKNANILKVRYELDREKCGVLVRFPLKFKFLYRRLIIGVKKCIKTPVLLSNIILYGVIGGVIIFKNVLVDYSCFTWWDKFLFAIFVSFIFTVIKRLIKNKGFNKDKGGNHSEPIMKDIVNNKGNKITSSKDNNININDNKDEDNKVLKNKLSNKLVKFIINIILGLFIYLWVGIEFGFFNTIYCDSTDGDNNNTVDSNKNNKSASENKDVKGKNKEDSYNISANVGKGMIKEAVEGAIEGIGKSVPVIIGGMVGGSLGVAAINASKSLPPVQKAAVGVVTAIVGSFGVTSATGIAKELVKNVSKSKEEENPVNVSSVSNNKTGSGDSGKDGLIPSILESGDELSPLQMILNYEIILGILILLHICILNLIGLHKLYVSSVWNIINKIFSKETTKKYEKFMKMIEKIGKRYLILLIIINVVFILFDLGVIIYANIELSNNIEDFIQVHLNMKNSIIMLLFVKSKFIVNKNKKGQK